jgi:hypothetical protein
LFLISFRKWSTRLIFSFFFCFCLLKIKNKDNIIVTGALSKDDEIWDNVTPTTNPAEVGDDLSLKHFDKGDVNWEELCKKWKVTLVDFGFARALQPGDVKKPSLEIRRENLDASFHHIKHGLEKNGGRTLDGSQRSHSSLGNSSRGRRRFLLRKSSDDFLNVSRSHLLGRRMSALGNRNFAAPEIVNKVQRDSKHTAGSANGPPGELTDTISEYVSDYGLMVDAYSMGHTLRYFMTGVPPYLSIAEAIAAQDSICSKLCGGKKKTARRSVRYRPLSELPTEVQRLIEHLTERLESKRISIRKARRTYPWINDVVDHTDRQESEEQRHSLGEISYLPLAMKGEEDKTEKTETTA